MSDLRPNCFCGRIICTEWESFVLGIGLLIMQIALATFPTFLTCLEYQNIMAMRTASILFKGKFITEMSIKSKQINIYVSEVEHLLRIITLFVKYEGSQTTFLHFAVSPSEVTPTTLPSSSNSTCILL